MIYYLYLKKSFLLAKEKEIKDLYLATNKLGAMKFVEC